MPSKKTTQTDDLDQGAVLDLIKALDEPVTDENVATLAGAPVAAVASILDDLVTAGQLSQDDDGFYVYIPDDPDAPAPPAVPLDDQTTSSDERDSAKDTDQDHEVESNSEREEALASERDQTAIVLSIPNVRLVEMLSTLSAHVGPYPVPTGSRVIVGKPDKDGVSAFSIEISGICNPPKVREDFNRDMTNPQMEPMRKHVADQQAQDRLHDSLREERERAEREKRD